MGVNDIKANIFLLVPGVFVMTSVLLIPSLAWSNSLEDTHRFRLGVYEQDIDVTGSATRDPLPEIELDFDKVLGLEESGETYLFSYRWRFKEKWSLLAFYSQFGATGKKVATIDFNFGGKEYTAGSKLGTEFDLDTYLLTVNYSFVKDDKKELGVGFGLHAFDIETTIEADVGIEDVQRERVRTQGDVLAPLPNLRFYGSYMLTPRWEVSISGGWLSFSYDDYDGGYLFLTAFGEYRFTDRFGVGVSYQTAEIDVTHESGRDKEKFDIALSGPSIYLTYGF